MAVANLQGLVKPDDIALAWAKFLLNDIVEQREAQVRPVIPGIYVFGMEGTTPTVPSVPEVFDPETVSSLEGLLARHEGAYAYLAVMPGLPIPKSEWSGASTPVAKKQLLGIPTQLIETGDYPWFLMAYFYSHSCQMTFCGAFDGSRFREIKCMYGTYGGCLPALIAKDN